MAEAQFREGECLLQLNDAAAAAWHFQKACDCDALVFRADSRINGIIRETGRQLGGPDLVLCDAAASLPEAGKIPGQETFYEHVHFNFDGNYRLALLWAAQAGRLLPENVKTKAQGGWASQEVCEARLGLTDWNRSDVLNAVRQRLEGPPLQQPVQQRSARVRVDGPDRPHDPAQGRNGGNQRARSLHRCHRPRAARLFPARELRRISRTDRGPQASRAGMEASAGVDAAQPVRVSDRRAVVGEARGVVVRAGILSPGGESSSALRRGLV